MSEERERKPDTQVAHLGRNPRQHLGAVNTPVYRASTILFDSVAELEAAARGESPGVTYGLHGLPTVTDLQEAIAELEGGHAALAVPSGLAAITLALLAVTRAGDHVLVTDSIYGPTRRFCDNELSRFGIDVSYYDPLAGDAIESDMRASVSIGITRPPTRTGSRLKPSISNPGACLWGIILEITQIDSTRLMSHGIDFLTRSPGASQSWLDASQIE